LHAPSSPTAGEKSGFLGSLPVTSLSDLERTGAVPLASSEPLEGDFPTDGGLALEERTPPSVPVRDGTPRWDEPEATNAVAVGVDGFQEVDLAAGAAPPDPDFDPIEPEPTPPVAQRPSPPAGPPPVLGQQGDPSAPGPIAAPAPESAPPAPATPEAPVPPPPRSTRIRVLAVNVLSLAALLVVTAGILFWWRGEGIGAGLRWPGSPQRGDVEVGQVSSGVYEASRGHPLVFVRGVLKARAPVAGPLAVRVEFLRAGASLGVATGVAGAVPTPEELAAVATSEDLARLQGELRARPAAALTPGTDLPFLVVLARPDGDAGDVRFRIELVPSPGR
jgi:hypothetical protein